MTHFLFFFCGRRKTKGVPFCFLLFSASQRKNSHPLEWPRKFWEQAPLRMKFWPGELKKVPRAKFWAKFSNFRKFLRKLGNLWKNFFGRRPLYPWKNCCLVFPQFVNFSLHIESLFWYTLLGSCPIPPPVGWEFKLLCFTK